MVMSRVRNARICGEDKIYQTSKGGSALILKLGDADNSRNTQDSVKINDLTSRLIDRKAIAERGEVAQGCQAVGQMPTWLQGLRRGIRSLLTVRVLIFFEASLFRRRVYQPQHDPITLAKRKIVSIILAQGAAEHRYILGGCGQRRSRNPKTVCPGQMSGRKDKTCRVGTDASE